MKLGLKFSQNRMYNSRVIQLCQKKNPRWMFSEFPVSEHSALLHLWLWSLYTKFREDQPIGSKVIGIFVSHWNAWSRGGSIFKIFDPLKAPPLPKWVLLTHYSSKSVQRFGLYPDWWTPKNDEHVGYAPGKTRRSIFLNWHTNSGMTSGHLCQFLLNFLKRYRGSKLQPSQCCHWQGP